MTTTTFWSPDGTQMSAKQFIEKLHGDLPELFKNEDELIALWASPDTRKKLLEGLEEKGCGIKELKEISRLIDAEKSDLFDVLAYISFTSAPVTRKERVNRSRDRIFGNYEDKQRDFLNFVLENYIAQGVEELYQEKLPVLLTLKYNSIPDAVAKLGIEPAEIKNMFSGFQEHLYAAP